MICGLEACSIAGTSSRTLCLGRSGDESLVSGGRGECARLSEDESLERGGKGERASGDRILEAGSFGANLATAGRLRGGDGEREDNSPVRSIISGGRRWMGAGSFGFCGGPSSSLIRLTTSLVL